MEVSWPSYGIVTEPARRPLETWMALARYTRQRLTAISVIEQKASCWSHDQKTVPQQ
jgi:hypothetical protein